MAVLRATRGLDGGAAYELKQPAVLLGRNPKRCDVVLEHYAVSREHARVAVIDSDFYIEDLKSRNGVRLNGRRLQPGTEGRQRLQVGDRIEIAAFEFCFEETLPLAGMVRVLDDVQKPDIVSTFHVGSDSSIKSRGHSKIGRLHILVGIIEDLSRELDVGKVLPKIVSSLLRAFPQAHNGCLLLRREDGEFAPAAVERTGGESAPMRVSRAILDEVVANRQAILSTDSKSDPQPGGGPENQQQNQQQGQQPQSPSFMSAPLLDCDDVVFGVLQLEIQQGSQPFTPEDLELLSAVATHLAAVIENSRLHDSVLREQRSRYEARFRNLIEGSLQGILIHRHFRPLFVNEAWAALHGYTVAEVLGMESVLDLIAPEERDRAVALAKSWLQGDDPPPRYESKHLRKDGTAIWVEKFSSVVDWDGGPAIQTAVVDLTHRKQSEEALRQVHDELELRVADRTAELARSNCDLEQFAYSASHDLQAPLRTIASYCQLLQQRYGAKLDAGAHEFIDGAIEGAQRMKRLLDDLLCYARVSTEANSFRSADCNAVLQEVLRNLKVQAEECAASITSDPLPTVCCDATQLMQLFQNLISNAIAYRSEEPLRIHIDAEQREEDWCFAVRDNGVGIAPQYFTRIFQIFQRLYAEHEHPGSGVGLSLCKRIVERHGGEMWVESTPGSGSVFRFTIPKRQTPANAKAE